MKTALFILVIFITSCCNCEEMQRDINHLKNAVELQSLEIQSLQRKVNKIDTALFKLHQGYMENSTFIQMLATNEADYYKLLYKHIEINH